MVSSARLSAQSFVECDPGDREVRALAFRGNKAFSSDELELLVSATASSWSRRVFRIFGARRCLDPAYFPGDPARLRKFYRDRGYHSAQVDTLVEPLGSPNDVRVVFIIKEGLPIRIDSLRITGLEAVRNPERITEGLGLREGSPFDQQLLVQDIETIVLRLRNVGYLRPDVFQSYCVAAGCSPAADSLAARVELNVVPGPLVRIGDINVSSMGLFGGEQQISDDVVRKVLGIRRGDLYSDQAIYRGQQSLFQLQTYKNVAVRLDTAQTSNDSLVSLRVVLEEDYTRQLDTRTGWATLDCFHTRAQWTDRNFMRAARTLDLEAQISKIGYGYPLASRETRQLCYQNVMKKDPFSDTTNYRIATTLRQPRSFGGGWQQTYSLYRERRSDYQAYLRTTYVGLDLAFNKDVSDNGTVRLAYSLEYGRTVAQPALLCAVFNRCDQASRDEISKVAKPLAVTSAQYSLVRTNSVVAPSKGFVFRSEIRSSLTAFGSAKDFTFNKATVDGAGYLPVGRQGVLALRLRAGAVINGDFSISNATRYIPPQERLYAGGANSVRGFQQNQVGQLLYIAKAYDTVAVTDSTAFYRTQPAAAPLRVVPVGGNALLVANFEYRVPSPVWSNLLHFTFFVDGGDVWTRGQEGTGLGVSRMRWTPGLGVRVFTPVGPLQVNIGYNPYPQPTGPSYFDATLNPRTGVAPLFCVSPNNTIPVRLRPDGPVQDEAPCPATYRPPQPPGFFRRLTFTFSVGSEF